MVVLKKQDELVWRKRTTREQWINWFFWLIGISIVLLAWKQVSDKTIWFFVQDAPIKNSWLPCPLLVGC